VPVYIYNIFGLYICSPIEFPELEEVNQNDCDVLIEYGNVPDHLDQVISKGVLFEAGEKEFLLKLPHIGKYHVRNGDRITIDPKPGASHDEISLFLMGSVMGALLYQRGYLLLHGSAVEVKGKALVIIGNSAAGKSTLAAALNQAGLPLISDDLSAIALNNSEKCIILKGIPFIKLWKDTVNILYPVASFSKVRPQINKYKIPLGDIDKVSVEIPIDSIITLATRNEPSYKTRKISGAEKFSVLRDHAYRDQFIKGMGMLEHHFQMLIKLANQTEVFLLERPSIPLDIYSLRDYVISNIIGE
jgi:energy-coupling factor transporter ATP-binding protein EcfA2